MSVLEQNKTKPLKVLSASAGSGKTFSLVQEYLKLTLTEQTDGKASRFGSVLAMTFTNKAADEMKSRIISALDYIAFSDDQPKAEIEKAKDLLNTTSMTTGLSTPVVEERARKVLKEILHNYEQFTIQTLDKFSLRLIRTFSKELELNQDFEVVMDEENLLEKSVDNLLNNIGKQDAGSDTKMVLKYAKSNLEEGEKWNIRSSLFEFSKVLTKEKYKATTDAIKKAEFKEEDYKLILEKLKKIESDFEAQREETTEVYKGYNIEPTQCAGGTRGSVFAFFEKIETKSILDCVEFNATITKNLSGEKLGSTKEELPAELVGSIYKMQGFAKTHAQDYLKLKNQRNNYYNLALLKSIGLELDDRKVKDNILRISEFNELISQLLSKENAPFIYEQLGTRYRHYLLDEFQDTSKLQWRNLLPLVEDSIGNDYTNLIVGDPKQAIYRFRNGLVEQFDALPRIYNPEGDSEIERMSNHFESRGEVKPLEDNYRSQKKIVEFNNLFFPRIADELPDSKKIFYNSVYQNPKGKDGGYVELLFPWDLDKEEEKEEERTTLLKWIRECESDGFERGDICVLGRRKKQGRKWAKWLQEEGYKVVSVDSLEINADASVRLVIEYFELLIHRSSPTHQNKFTEAIISHKHDEVIEQLSSFWLEKAGKLDFDRFVANYFHSEENLFFSFESLYDLAKQFYQLLDLNELENPYLHHLLEMLHEYDKKNGPNITDFLDFWKRKGKNETVQVPENNEAIKLFTAHKSKGLEFPIVILPDLSFNLDIKDQFFEKEEDAFYYYKPKKESQLAFEKEKYAEEMEDILVDNMNLLYVALTRPVSRLYGRIPKSFENSIGEKVRLAINDLQSPDLVKGDVLSVKKKDFHPVVTMGAKAKKSEKSIEDNGQKSFFPENVKDRLWFPEISLQDKDSLDTEDLSEAQRKGNQIHLLLSEVNTIDELDRKIAGLIQKGLFQKENSAEAKKLISELFNNLDYQALFKDHSRILNEQLIILDENNSYRPDKLIVKNKSITIIDFKTGTENAKYRQQIQNYSFVLKEMGYEDVSGYLIYLDPIVLKQVV